MNDFKAFIARGNVFELAVGIVIGAAFATVVKSFVDDILMPPVGQLIGGVDFANLYLNLSDDGRYATLAEAKEAGAVTLNYGVFLNNLISFLIVAFAVFLFVRGFNRMQANKAADPPPPGEADCPLCLMRIPALASRCGHCTADLASRAAAPTG